MIRLAFFIIFAILLSTKATANVDSLKALLDDAEGKDRIEVLIPLMKELQRSDPESAIDYSDEALNLLRLFPEESKTLDVLYHRGWAYIYQDNFDSVKVIIELIEDIARKTGSDKGKGQAALLKSRVLRTEGIYDSAVVQLNTAIAELNLEDELILKAKLLNELGSVQRRLSNYDEALDNHKSALSILKNFNDEELTTTYTYLGIINDIKGNFNEALTCHQAALELNRKRNDIRGIAAATHNIGILYQKTARYDKALEYYNKAIVFWKELNNKNALASTLNSIGGVNELKENYRVALDYYIQALDIWEKLDSKYSVAIALNNIGSIYEALGEYDRAMSNLKRAINIRKSLGDKNGTAGSLLVLAAVYEKLDRTSEAIATAQEGSKLAQEIGSWSTIRQAHLILSDIYEKSGRYKEAIEEYKKYKAVHDSIFNIESQEVIAELEAKYNNAEQQRQIELLQRDSEIQTLYRTILFAGLALALIILILIYNRYRLKKRAHSTLEQLHKSELETAKSKANLFQMEFEQKKKELEAARSLQLSMLPSGLPKNPEIELAAAMQTATEVGGDYYDFYEDKNGNLTIAIGDAAGHGAEAGTMVTATKSLFNLLSPEKNIDEILNKINYSMRKLRLPNLFMAMGIVRLSNNTVELAGAGMPAALIYRADTKKVEPVPLKGLPLGSVADFTYSKINVNLNSGDVVALMSDGLPELFNEKKEMFGYENVIRVFEKTANESPADIIKHFFNSAKGWINGGRQQDDMTFIVFRKR